MTDLVYLMKFQYSKLWTTIHKSSSSQLSKLFPVSTCEACLLWTFPFISVFPLFAEARWCKQLPVTVSVVVFISALITVHLPSVIVATMHCDAAQRSSLCAADVFSLEPANFPQHTLSTIWNWGQACSESWCVAVYWELIKVQRYGLYRLCHDYGPFVIFRCVWMRPHKTLNHYVRLNH